MSLLRQEEIEIHRNSLFERNEKLAEASGTIETVNYLIQQKNSELIVDVERQTHDLKQTNHELIEQNNRLEQFAFIISHNLRAPLILRGYSVFRRSTHWCWEKFNWTYFYTGF